MTGELYPIQVNDHVFLWDGYTGSRVPVVAVLDNKIVVEDEGDERIFYRDTGKEVGYTSSIHSSKDVTPEIRLENAYYVYKIKQILGDREDFIPLETLRYVLHVINH